MHLLTIPFSEFFRFCCVGGIGFLVDYSLMEALIHQDLTPSIARLISIAVIMQLMYFLHSRFTYQNHHQRGIRTWMKFAATNLVGALVNYLLFLKTLEVLHYDSAPMNRLYAVIIGTSFALFCNYLMNRRFTFSSKDKR